MTTILVTNDDGINSEGLKALVKAVSGLGEVFIVAPDRERSGVGLSITLEHPLRATQLAEKTYSVNGMPTDCVELALHRLMEFPPDLIVSGINYGQNLGYDIFHSGTVGAAIAGTMFGIPSMAISIATVDFDGEYKGVTWFDSAAQVTTKLAKSVIKRKLPHGTLLNVNVPNLPLSRIGGIEITRHCNATYDIEISHRTDPRGKEYYWVGGIFQECDDDSKTDLSALHRRKISVTPLHLDLTDYQMMKELSGWGIGDSFLK